MKRLLSWLLVVLVLAGGGYGVYRWRVRSTHVAPKYRTAKVDRGQVSSKVTATGTLSARVTVLVGSQVSGRLQDIYVDFNSPVKKGQVIARIDPRLLQADLQRARANYMQSDGQAKKSKVQVAQAQRALDRAIKLKAEGLLGDADLEIAQSNLEGAKADLIVAQGSVAQAAAALNTSEVNLGFATIISPIDGTVISRAVDVGQTVAASLSAPTLFTIAQDLKLVQIDSFVAEADIGKLKEGMDATFTVDAYPGQKFPGKVRMIRNAAQTVQNVVTYDAVIDVDNSDLKLRPGMTVNVTFVWADRKDALRIPNAALRFKPPADPSASASASGGGGGGAGAGGGGAGGGGGGGGAGGGGGGKKKKDDAGAVSPKRTIYVLRNGTSTPVPIEIGISDGTLTEVTSGELKEGDDVITELEDPAAAKATGGSAANTTLPRRF